MGHQWRTRDRGFVFALALSPSSSSTVFAGTDAGLYKSIDSGMSWTPVTNGLTASIFYALYFDPASPSTLYAGTDRGVLKSADGGTSWTPMNTGLTNPVVNAIVRAPGPMARCTSLRTVPASSS